MDVHVSVEIPQEGVKIFEGPLAKIPISVRGTQAGRSAHKMVPLLQEDDRFGNAVISGAPPGRRKERPWNAIRGVWINWALFLATIVTATWAGAAPARR